MGPLTNRGVRWRHFGRTKWVVDRASLRFAFKASNNQAKYEALIAGMLLAKEMAAKSLMAKSDSLLVTG